MANPFFKEISITAPGSTLTNYPKLIRVTDDADIFAATVDGHEIKFFADSDLTTPLTFERVWATNSVAFNAEFYVNVPSLGVGSPTLIYMSYGDDADSDASDPATLWPIAGHESVYHFDDIDPINFGLVGAIGPTFDDINTIGSGASPLLVGRRAINTNSSSSFAKTLNDCLNGANNYSVLLIAKPNAAANTFVLASWGSSTTNTIYLQIGGSTNASLSVRVGGTSNYTGTHFDAAGRDDWHYFDVLHTDNTRWRMTFDDLSGQIDENRANNETRTQTNLFWRFDAAAGAGDQFMEEMRFMSVLVSDAWREYLTAEFLTAGFLIVLGVEQNAPAGAGVSFTVLHSPVLEGSTLHNPVLAD